MIYMDNAAMQRPGVDVIEEVDGFMRTLWFNPSASYRQGREVKRYIEMARANVAKLIGADPSEIHFTSGATESATILLTSLLGCGEVYITDGEHPAVDNISKFEFGRLPIDKYGLIYDSDLPLFSEYDSGDGMYTTLCINYANNEIGTIQSMYYIGNNVCKNRGFLLASDLTQAFGHIPIDVKESRINFGFGSGQKIGGLSGCGFLYVQKEYEHLIKPICVGGQQDMYKGGTENITGIIALGKACENAYENLDDNIKKITALRDYMIGKILTEIPDTILIGHPTDRLPNNVNIGFGNCDSESIVQYLDMYDICASAGSACHTKSVEPSHVLKALRLPDKYINGSVRFTLSSENTIEEIDEVVKILKQFYANKDTDI